MTHWMRGEIEAGAVAGLGSGLFVGLLTESISLVVPGGGWASSLRVLAVMMPLPPEIAAVVALGYCAVLGGLFGWLHRGEWLGTGAALVRGGLYGASWGIVLALVVGSALRDLLPFSHGALGLARPLLLVAMTSHTAYGMLVGLGFSAMTYRVVGR